MLRLRVRSDLPVSAGIREPPLSAVPFEEDSSPIFRPLCSSLLTERQTASLPKLPNEVQVSPSGRASRAVTVRSRAWNPGKAVLSASTWRTSATRLPRLCRFFSKPFNSFLRGHLVLFVQQTCLLFDLLPSTLSFVSCSWCKFMIHMGRGIYAQLLPALDVSA